MKENNNELVKFTFEKLPAFQDAKKEAENLRDSNPVIEVIDSKSYKKAKESRQELREKGRYKFQNEEKIVIKHIKEKTKDISGMYDELISIVQPSEERHDENIKAYEKQKQEEKEAEARKEAERLEGLRNKLNELITQKSTSISVATIATIDSVISDIENTEESFDDFQADFDEKKRVLIAEAQNKKSQLEEKEKLRIQKEEQEAEAKRLKEEAENLKKEKEEAERKRQAEAKKQKQDSDTELTLKLLILMDKEIINMTSSSEEKEISTSLEKSIDGDFGEREEEVRQAYNIIKTKLSKQKVDLLEKEQAEKVEKEKQEKQRQKLGLSRQEQLKGVGVSKSIDECLGFSETAYFEFYQKEQKVFVEIEKIKKLREEAIYKRKEKALFYLLENGFEEIDGGVNNKKHSHFIGSNHYSDLESDEELDKFINVLVANAKKHEKNKREEKRQSELAKTDQEKAKDLTADIEALKTKYEFKSDAYIKKYETLKQALDESINYINK
jgi:hypothetical protein